jgi:hypothetical protein
MKTIGRIILFVICFCFALTNQDNREDCDC